MVSDQRAVARALGGQVAGRDTVLIPGPGHSARDRSLAVRFDSTAPDGFLIFSHAGDDWRECRDYVRERLGLPPWEPGDEQQRTVPPQHIDKWDLAAIDTEASKGPRTWTEDELIRIANARRIWEEGQDPRGTLAEKYLREHRKVNLPDDLACRVLRFHPACPWRNETTGRPDRIPTLIASFRSIDDDAVTGIHRIALEPFSAKPDRRMLGIVHRAAIKLDPIDEQLAIGEGIETCMASREFGYGQRGRSVAPGAFRSFRSSTVSRRSSSSGNAATQARGRSRSAARAGKTLVGEFGLPCQTPSSRI